jgi:hypothetical protein
MGFALAVRELSQRRGLLALGVVVAAMAALLSVYRLDGLNLKPRSLKYSSASTQAIVDSSSSALGNLSQSFEDLSNRAAVYANFMTSPAVLSLIGRQVGLRGEQIYAEGPVNPNVPRVVQEPTALKRNVEITGETTPYRLSFENQPNLPSINIFAQAPTTAQAVALANASVVGLQRYVASLEAEDKIPAASRVTVRQLGPANGSVVDGSISKQLAVMVFVAVFALWCVLMLVVPRLRATWRQSAALQEAGADAWHGEGDERGREAAARARAAREGAVRSHAPGGEPLPRRGHASEPEDEEALLESPESSLFDIELEREGRRALSVRSVR